MFFQKNISRRTTYMYDGCSYAVAGERTTQVWIAYSATPIVCNAMCIEWNCTGTDASNHTNTNVLIHFQKPLHCIHGHLETRYTGTGIACLCQQYIRLQQSVQQMRQTMQHSYHGDLAAAHSQAWRSGTNVCRVCMQSMQAPRAIAQHRHWPCGNVQEED